MTRTIEPLDKIWSDLLSRDPVLIRMTFAGISKTDQAHVCRHLKKMVVEEGWHPEQKRSAQVALDVINKKDTKNNP